MHDPRDLAGIVRDELDQRRTSGFDIDGLAREVDDALGRDRKDLESLLLRIEATDRSTAWPYTEPAVSELDPQGPTDRSTVPSDLADRVHGAWLGRCAGCLLGKPIEGWPAPIIREFLEAHARWPPVEYLSAPDPWPAAYPAPKPSSLAAVGGRNAGMPRDDDIDYTILGLHILEEHGRDFTTDDVATELLDHLPFTQVFTAERVTYRNLVNGVSPARSGTTRNPYREWIGALIRADVYGYVSPGAPASAAAMALRDARLTHDANGVYAAMWAAATIAAALTAGTARDAIAAGLAHVPPGSRLHEAVDATIEAHDAGLDWDAAYAWLHERFGTYHWVHAINNAAAIAAAALWGEGDVGRTIGQAVAVGWDTDSAGATAGSIAGALSGAAAIPDPWVAPLDDRVSSSIAGFDGIAISSLAERTLALAMAGRSEGSTVAAAT